MAEEVFRSANKRTKDIHIRLNEEEFEMLCSRAKAAMHTQVGWIRYVIRKGCSPRVRIYPWQADLYCELQQYRVELKKMKELNEFPQQLTAELKKMEDLIQRILKKLINDCAGTED
ncbi:MAG: hypothetical protein JWN76_2845 [Chitinophagaceae bacterium]|nr:hypothetical protein [Chitinophagaceae bacterium]